MSKHKGWSAYRRNGRWAVSWRDGSKKRRTIYGIATERAANEIGKIKAAEAARVRTGAVTQAESTGIEAKGKAITVHLDAFEKMLAQKGNTAAYVKHTRSQVGRVATEAGIENLGQLNSDRIQTAIAKIADDSSPQNARHYLTAFRGFVRWCLKTDRLLHDPIKAVKRPNVAGETFSRRPITPDELEAICHAAETRKSKHSTIPGADRAMYYRMQAYTGLRVSETRSLTPESFDLAGGFVTIDAAYAKNKRKDDQPLRDDFIAHLRPWLATKQPCKFVFAYKIHANVRRVFKADCKFAGIEAKPGERLGMHSLRRFYITSVVRAGGLAAGQDLARHSDPKLTKKYVDLNKSDYDKALGGLPAVGPKVEPKQERRAM